MMTSSPDENDTVEAAPAAPLDAQSNLNEAPSSSSAATMERPEEAGANRAAKTEPTEVNPLTDFVTTSYVIDSINAALNDVMQQEAEAKGEAEGGGSATASKSDEKKSFFELQKRMPDGSTRKATDEEMSSQDMKNKLEQAAQLTSKMTLEQKIEWAQKQRQQGNQLYQEGKYKQAIDIYLTCLIVRDTTKEKVNDPQVLILPVMNNLAQSALQLGWYHKAEVFCTLAMESLDDGDKEDCTGQAVAKLYFKRGKARRLRGCYDLAKKDLEQAMEKLGEKTEEKSPEVKSIEKEFQLLARAVAEGKKNRKRTQRAMQKVLGSSTTTKEPHSKDSSNDDKISISTTESTSPAIQSTNTSTAAATKPSISGTNDIMPTRTTVTKKPAPYFDDDDTSTPLYHEKPSRTHSTIRKRPEGPPPYERPRLPVQLSYWEIYRIVIGRVAQRLLDIIGEEEGTGFGGGVPTSVTTNNNEGGGSGNGRPKQD